MDFATYWTIVPLAGILLSLVVWLFAWLHLWLLRSVFPPVPENDETQQLLDELRAAFRLDSDRAAIRRALALARIVAREAGDGHSVVLRRKDGSMVELLLDR